METRIGQVRIHYRVPAGQSPATTLASLQNVAGQKIGDTCDQAFASVFEDDPTVYVIRRVTSRVAVLAKPRTSEARLAEQWGRNLCTSVVRTIVRNDDDDNLVRFENQSEFVSCFLTRLAVGDAWERWYFGAFTNYRGLPQEEIVIAVLEKNHQIVPQILTRLKRSNTLDFVLNVLGRTGQRHVWEKVIRSGPVDDQTVDAFRIFAQAAFGIADVLAIWQTVRPEESEVIESYLRTRPTSPNWTSGASLAEAVSSLIRFMLQERLLDVSSAPTDERVAELRDLLESTFDWLDSAQLFNSVLSIFDTPKFTTAKKEFTLRPRQATPAQKRILEELLTRLQSGTVRLASDSLFAHETLLRIVAALSDDETSVSSGTIGLLESVVKSAVAIQASSNAVAALQHLQRGDVSSITSSGDAVSHFKAVVEAGEVAQSLVSELVHQSIDSTDEEGIQIHSNCAGLFLLVRVIQDLRLASAFKEFGCDSIQPFLAGLAISIYKDTAWSNDSLDAGVGAWSGCNIDEAHDTLAKLEAIDWEQLTSAILEIATAQRLLDPSEPFDPIESWDGATFSPAAAASINRLGALLLKGWARWLPGLAHSSTGYLLDNFICRPGTIILGKQRIIADLERRPLDEILKLAGYLADTPPVAWLENRSVRYTFCK